MKDKLWTTKKYLDGFLICNAESRRCFPRYFINICIPILECGNKQLIHQFLGRCLQQQLQSFCQLFLSLPLHPSVDYYSDYLLFVCFFVSLFFPASIFTYMRGEVIP